MIDVPAPKTALDTVLRPRTPIRHSHVVANVMAGLLVIYSERVDECRDFYASLGLDLVREQHGAGPEHYAAELANGLVLEIYPSAAERTTGRLRLGLVVPSTAGLPEGEHELTDPR